MLALVLALVANHDSSKILGELMFSYSTYINAYTIVLCCLLACFSTSVPALERCISYTESSDLVASLELAEDSVFSDAVSANKKFIMQAKTNKTGLIVKNFSKLDGSYSFETKKLADDQELYSLYKGIKSFDHNVGFRWGVYLLSWGDYVHDKGRSKLLDSLICTNMCQVSNIFERPSEHEKLVSRYMSLVRTNSAALAECPTKDAEITITPTIMENIEFPLKVYFGKKLNPVSSEGIFDIVSNNSRVCQGVVKQVSEMTYTGEELKPYLGNFLDSCTINMSDRSLIPTVNVKGKRAEKNYLTVETFLSALERAVKTEKIFSVVDGKWLISYFSFTGNDQSKTLVVIPFVNRKNEKVIDWSYYGFASGEMLSSVFFANFIYNKINSP